jgi:hypothetical protein
MPWIYTTKNGKPAIKWGKAGKAQTYTQGDKASLERAKKRAEPQRRAIEAGKRRKR